MVNSESLKPIRFFIYWIQFSVIILSLVGCQVETGLPVVTEKPNPVLKISPRASESTPTNFLLLPTVTVELPQDALQATVTEKPSQTEIVAQRAFSICSPLALESIPELFEIVSDPYKPPPMNRKEERHHGVDFSHYTRKNLRTIELEPINSIMDGRVAAVIEDQLPYGNMVIVETSFINFPPEFIKELNLSPDYSVYVLYAHMYQKPQVIINENVECGQNLGEVGKSGYNIINPHLHLEIRIGPPDISFAEMAFYTTSASLSGMENYIRWRTGGEFVHIDPMKVFDYYLEWIKTHTE